jgi:hypothetical protein
MRGSTILGLLAVPVLLLVSNAAAAPITDGSVGGVEYAVAVPDMLGPETGFDSNHLNIDKMFFDKDADPNGFYYVGLTVVDPPVDSNGGATSRTHRTVMELDLSLSSGGNQLYLVQVELRGSSSLLRVSDANNNFSDVPLVSGADYFIAVGDALEFKILQSKMPLEGPVAAPFFSAMLSDDGFANDDQMEGTIPEPMTLGLVALGLPLLAWRRRR